MFTWHEYVLLLYSSSLRSDSWGPTLLSKIWTWLQRERLRCRSPTYWTNRAATDTRWWQLKIQTMKALRTSLSCRLHEVSAVCVLLPASTAVPLHGVTEPTKYFHCASDLIAFPGDCIFLFLQRSCVCSKVAGAVIFMNRFWPEPIKWLGMKMTMMYLPSVLMFISLKH